MLSTTYLYSKCVQKHAVWFEYWCYLNLGLMLTNFGIILWCGFRVHFHIRAHINSIELSSLSNVSRQISIVLWTQVSIRIRNIFGYYYLNFLGAYATCLDRSGYYLSIISLNGVPSSRLLLAVLRFSGGCVRPMALCHKPDGYDFVCGTLS